MSTTIKKYLENGKTHKIVLMNKINNKVIIINKDRTLTISNWCNANWDDIKANSSTMQMKELKGIVERIHEYYYNEKIKLSDYKYMKIGSSEFNRKKESFYKILDLIDLLKDIDF